MSAPAVAVSRDGKKIAAAWMDERTGKKDRRVYWAVSDSGSDAGSLSFKKDLPVELDSVLRQDHPALMFDAAGTLWAAWEEKERSGKRLLQYAQN